MESTLTTLRASFDDLLTLPEEFRRAQLRALHAALTDESELFAEALLADVGRHRAEAHLVEIDVSAAEVDYAIRHLRRWMKPRRAAVPLATMPARAWTHRAPKGVALIIAPWNYPVLLALTPLAGAIAAGCPAVIKPSELAPETSRVIADVLGRYLDPRAYAVIEGGVEIATELLEQRWDHIFFTGSTRVGTIIAKKAANTLTPVTLELGGKSPAYVDRSVDLTLAARRIAWGRYINAGQTCVAVDYVLASPDVADELASHIDTWVHEFYGASLDNDSLGRMVSTAAFDRVTRYLSNGHVAVGGGHDRDRLHIEPTVLTRVSRSAPVMQDEVFGPVLPIVDVRDLDDAIEFVRSRPRPLTAHVFSLDRQVRREWTARTQSGALAFGAPLMHLGVPGIPFGGTGASGIGNYHGERSFMAFTYERAVMSKPYWADLLPLVYPPYDKRTEAIITRVIPWAARTP